MFFSRSKKDTIDTRSLLPLVLKLGEYIKQGMDHYQKVNELGKKLDPDSLAIVIEMYMSSWEPQIQKKKLLDLHTKKSAARFLAGIICNYSKEVQNETL